MGGCVVTGMGMVTGMGGWLGRLGGDRYGGLCCYRYGNGYRYGGWLGRLGCDRYMGVVGQVGW